MFGLGNMLPVARQAADLLAAEGFDVAIVNPRFTKPIAAAATEFFGRAADVVVTLEDHVLPGGYGSSVLELYSEKRVATPVVRVSWSDQCIEHATTVDELRQKYGLTAAAVVSQVKAQFASTIIDVAKIQGAFSR